MQSISTILIKQLAESTEPSSNDYLVIGGNDAKKISVDNFVRYILLAAHPIGSIYESEDPTSPEELFGGTWEEYGKGLMTVAYDAEQEEFNTIGKTGGNKTHTNTVDEMPSHTHTGPSHAHTIPAHNHGLNSHTHSIPALTGTAASAGAHSHNMRYSILAASGSAVAVAYANGSNNIGNVLVNNGAHTHNVTTTASTTGKASGNTANKAAFDTKTAGTGNTGSAGSGKAFSILPPHIVVYRWRRIA